MPLGRVVSPIAKLRYVPISFRKARGDRKEAQRLLDAASRLEPRIRRAFLDAIEALGERLDTKRLADLLREGRIAEAIADVNAQLSTAGFRALATAVSQGALTAGVAAVETALGAKVSQLEVMFSITNPHTAAFLNRYEMNLVRELAGEALASVRAAIYSGVTAGRNPLDIARDVRQFIGLTERQTQAVLNFRRMLEEGDRDVLSRALRDKRFDSTVQRALDGDGELSDEQIDRMVERYADRYLKYRSETIARTEAIRATTFGNDQMWRQAVASGVIGADQVTRHWVYTHDSKTRDAHVAIPSMNPEGVGLDEPFDSPLGPIMYPGDPNADPANTINCRCSVVIRYEVTPEAA